MKAPPVAILLLVILLLAGCAHYAPPEEPVTLRLALAPIVNQAEVPQVIAPLARNLREKMAHSRRFRLTEPAEADAILHLTLVGYNRRAMARDPEDTGRPLSFLETLRVNLDWESELPPPWGPETRHRVETEANLYGQPGLVASEYAALAAMADDLAEKIIRQLEHPLPIPASR